MTRPNQSIVLAYEFVVVIIISLIILLLNNYGVVLYGDTITLFELDLWEIVLVVVASTRCMMMLHGK